jgi:polysaccharide export outer membrane protein
MKQLLIHAMCVAALGLGASSPATAQQALQPGLAKSVSPATGVDYPAPATFVIGAGDVLSVTFWRDEKLSGNVIVRPDGMISLPLLNDVPAAGYTPEALAGVLAKAASQYISEPDVTVIVREIHSRRVFLVGEVATPGIVTLTGDMNVLQLLAVGGGLLEYADKDHIVIIRNENGQEKRLKFNYNDVIKGKNTKQNVLLQSGDTVVVP